MSRNKTRRIIAVAAAGVVAVAAVAVAGPSAALGHDKKPTIVLVHGAFADASGWNGTVERLLDDGYPVVAAANPLRGVASDAVGIKALLNSIAGPIVLVGHSYGGMVISAAAAGDPDVKALVYVAAFSPLAGESAAELSALLPGSSLGETLRPVALPDGGTDLYVDQKLFPQQFAADVPKKQAVLMAATQRPVTAAALNEEATGPQAWQSIPSYYLIPTADKNIPPAVQQLEAKRAHAKVLTLKGGSHAVFVAQPGKTASFIERAAR